MCKDVLIEYKKKKGIEELFKEFPSIPAKSGHLKKSSSLFHQKMFSAFMEQKSIGALILFFILGIIVPPVEINSTLNSVGLL